MLITGAAPPGGGRSEVTPRFVRHFNVFCVPQASTTAMQLIFSSMLKVWLRRLRVIRRADKYWILTPSDVFHMLSGNLQVWLYLSCGRSDA